MLGPIHGCLAAKEIGVVFTAEVLRAGIGLLGLGILDSVELVCMGVATPFVLEMNLNCATFSMPRIAGPASPGIGRPTHRCFRHADPVHPWRSDGCPQPS